MSPVNHEQLLILSDIHFGELAQSPGLRGGNLAETKTQMQGATEKIRNALEKTNLKPTLLIVPGDLTSRGSPGEFALTRQFLELVSAELRIPREHTVITYGNHDVDWAICRLGDPGSAGRDAYRKLAAHVGFSVAPGAKPTAAGPVDGSGAFELGSLCLLVLNSGIECYALEKDLSPFTEYHHGRIGNEQLEWLKSLPTPDSADKLTRIAIIHHHLVNISYPKHINDISLLAEGAEVRKEFGRLGVDIIIHGHRHHPHLNTTTQTGWNRPVTTICAGSYGVNPDHRFRGCIPNTFHVIALAECADTGNRAGKVFSFRQQADEGWSLLSNDDSDVDLDGIQWFGSPSGEVTLDAQAEQVVSALMLSVAQSGFARLPLLQDLPLSLRCQRSEKINAKFSRAANLVGLEVTGKYPGICILTKKP